MSSSAEVRGRARASPRPVAAAEALVAAGVVLLDLLIPSLVILALAGVSLAARRTGWASLGLRRWRTRGLPLRMLAFAAAWSLVQLGLTMPLANHLSGRRTDLGAFADLEGDPVRLLLFLLAGWLLGAVVEEVAFRGYLLTRAREALGGGRLGTVLAVASTSVLFGLLHTEQGLVGVLTISLDAVAFVVLRLRYATVWAPVLAHGFGNSIGFVTFFLVGPVHGLW